MEEQNQTNENLQQESPVEQDYNPVPQEQVPVEKKNWPLIIGSIVLVFIIVGGGIYWWLQSSKITNVVTKNDINQNQEEVLEEDDDELVKPALENNKYEYDGIELYYIDKENGDLSYNLFIKKDGQEKMLADDILFDAPGGGVPEFFKTDNPNIVLLKAGLGDMGGYTRQYYYVDLYSEDILKIVETQDSLDINGDKLTLGIEKRCPPRTGDTEYEGGVDWLESILINGVEEYKYPAYVQLYCIDPGGFGDIYSNQPHITFNRIDSSMKLIYFEIFGEEFYYDLNNSEIVVGDIE